MVRTIKAKLQKVLKRHGKFVPRIDFLKSINREQLEIIRELKAELEMERNKKAYCPNCGQALDWSDVK